MLAMGHNPDQVRAFIDMVGMADTSVEALN